MEKKKTDRGDVYLYKNYYKSQSPKQKFLQRSLWFDTIPILYLHRLMST